MFFGYIDVSNFICKLFNLYFTIKEMSDLDLFIYLEIAFFFLILWLVYSRLKGAEYAPTTSKRAKIMLDFASITSKDKVYELGSGLGGLTFKAGVNAKKAIGIEYDYLRYLISKIRLLFSGAKNVEFIRDDIFSYDFSDADVVLLFLKQKTNQLLKGKLSELKKGTRIVSNMWTFEGWKPIRIDKERGIYLYIIGKSNN